MHMSRQMSCSLEAMVNKPCLCHTNTEYWRRACHERQVTNLTHEQGPCGNTASSLTPESPQQAFRMLSKKLSKLSWIIGFSKWRHSNRRRGAKILVAAILAPLTRPQQHCSTCRYSMQNFCITWRYTVQNFCSTWRYIVQNFCSTWRYIVQNFCNTWRYIVLNFSRVLASHHAKGIELNYI